MSQVKNFNKFLNENSNDPKYYKNYVFTQGIFNFNGDLEYSWHFIKQFSKDGVIKLKVLNPSVIFQFIQGVPTITVPARSHEASGNVIIDDIDGFVKSREFRELNKFVKFTGLPLSDFKDAKS